MGTAPFPSSYFGFAADDLPANQRALSLGSVADPNMLVSICASADTVADVWTGTVGGAVTSVSYTNSLGTVETITVASSTTAAGLLSALADACEADSTLTVLSEYTLVSTGSTTFTATARYAGRVGTFSNTTNLTYSHTSTGAVGSDLPLARAVRRFASSTGAGVQDMRQGDIPYGIGNQVITLTPVFGASSYYNISIVLKNWRTGEDAIIIVGKVAADTNTATDCTAIAAAINAALAANTFLADGSSGTTVVLTSEVAGLTGAVSVTISGGAATCSVTYTTGSPGNAAYDMDAAFCGIVARSTAIRDDSSGNPVIPVRQMGSVAALPGRILVTVESGDSPAEDGAVWIGTAAANSGKFYAAAGADRAPISRRTATWGAANGSYRWLKINRSLL